MDTQLVADLKAARALCERGWCQGQSALDGEGQPTSPSSARVAMVCAMGAIDRTAPIGLDYTRHIEIADAIRRAVDAISIVDWNDAPDRTHADVLSAFDRAIALAGQERAP
jgi:hypothetical protein